MFSRRSFWHFSSIITPGTSTRVHCRISLANSVGNGISPIFRLGYSSWGSLMICCRLNLWYFQQEFLPKFFREVSVYLLKLPPEIYFVRIFSKKYWKGITIGNQGIIPGQILADIFKKIVREDIHEKFSRGTVRKIP